MQKVVEGHETPRSAFSVVLGLVLESTRKLTWLELVGLDDAPATCAWMAPVAVVAITASEQLSNAMRVGRRRAIL